MTTTNQACLIERLRNEVGDDTYEATKAHLLGRMGERAYYGRGSRRELSHAFSSQLISTMIEAAKSSRPAIPADRPTETPDDVVAGIYFVAETEAVFHVVASKSNADRLYAKRLIPGAPGAKRGTFEYDRGAIYKLRGSDALTPERMAEIGKHLGWCLQCGALLCDPKSVRAGFGPTCAKKHGVPYTDKARKEAGLPL
jgi:hypothetical protein